MPDEPIETPPMETPPVETPPPPVEAPPVVEEEPAPLFSWEFPETPPAEAPAPPGPPADGEPDVYGQGIQQTAVMTAVQMNTAMQKNLSSLKANLARNNATDEAVARAEEEFWKFGVGAANPESVAYATKLALGAMAMEGKPVTKPRPKVTAPGAPPVGNIPQSNIPASRQGSVNMALEAFNKELAALGEPLMTEEDFAGVE